MATNEEEHPDVHKFKLICVNSSAFLCLLALILVISFSAGGWRIVVVAGTEESKCTAVKAHGNISQALFRDVCVNGGTETPFSGIHDNQYPLTGTYRCGCCGAPLFPASTKFDSGTGWPSYWAPAAGEAVGYATHWNVLTFATEVHCKTCGAHLGHVFDDGRDPTGLRYCINSVCLRHDDELTVKAHTNTPWIPNDILFLLVAVGGILGLVVLCCYTPCQHYQLRKEQRAVSHSLP